MNSFHTAALVSLLLVAGCGDDSSGSESPNDAGPMDSGTAADSEPAGPNVSGGWALDEGTEACLQLQQTEASIGVTLCMVLGDSAEVSCETGKPGSISGQNVTFGFHGYEGTLTLSEDGESMSGLMVNDDKCDPEGCELTFQRLAVACDDTWPQQSKE
jgi:hypothetical protein